MAAYAALVSLETIIHNLEHHSRPPITLHKEQARLLVEKVLFLQQFLKVYNPTLPYSKEADPLEARIAAAAYEAEDAIESHIFDKLNNDNGDGEMMGSDGLYEALEKVTEDMALIEKEAMEIRDTLEFNNQRSPADSSGSATSSTTNMKSMMVGADDLLLEMKDKLTSGARDLQTIPIVGMGGSDPPPNVQGNDINVLANLQSLEWIKDFTCSEQMVKSIPNIRKLKIFYDEGVDDRFCLTNLDCLNKLESLKCTFSRSMWLINYPQSLKKLTLEIDLSIYCQDILDKIGALPLLEKLKLRNYGTFRGRWETIEGQFRSLKFVSLSWFKGLQVWNSEASHFPRLEQLHLYQICDLEEIPSDFAEISTLRLIDISWCKVSVVESAKRILEEQEALYGEEDTTLQVKVYLLREEYATLAPALEGFKSPNFQFTILY